MYSRPCICGKGLAKSMPWLHRNPRAGARGSRCRSYSRLEGTAFVFRSCLAYDITVLYQKAGVLAVKAPPHRKPNGCRPGRPQRLHIRVQPRYHKVRPCLESRHGAQDVRPRGRLKHIGPYDALHFPHARPRHPPICAGRNKRRLGAIIGVAPHPRDLVDSEEGIWRLRRPPPRREPPFGGCAGLHRELHHTVPPRPRLRLRHLHLDLHYGGTVHHPPCHHPCHLPPLHPPVHERLNARHQLQL
mmetsp:Transcript_28710/g.91622  ORF Transcript_28710/g.91622 Transcript_28710/m.91622 type:complete len:244 (-) Transcript_28710:500-1231(-)